MEYDFFMKKAIIQAKKAYAIDEVPIGCVVVYQDKIIARGYNKRNTQKNATKHAEIIAIDKACKYINDWRLDGAVLFVTVEPCPMCMGAIIQSRIKTVVFGAYNKKAGCCGSIIDLSSINKFNHRVEVIGGVLEGVCADLMKDFFKKLRKSGGL